MQDILEKAKDIEDSLQYDIGSQVLLEAMHSNVYTNHAMVKSSKQMIGAVPKGTVRQTMVNRQVSKPIQNMTSNTCKIPEIPGKLLLVMGDGIVVTDNSGMRCTS